MLGLGLIRRTLAEVRRDVRTAQTRDPAARTVGPVQVLVSWPGVHAVLAHRLAHELHSAEVPVLPRLISLGARTLTGIEIHPAARSGPGSSSTTGWVW